MLCEECLIDWRTRCDVIMHGAARTVVVKDKRKTREDRQDKTEIYEDEAPKRTLEEDISMRLYNGLFSIRSFFFYCALSQRG